QPAPSGRRDGCNHAPSSNFRVGMKNGQANQLPFNVADAGIVLMGVRRCHYSLDVYTGFQTQERGRRMDRIAMLTEILEGNPEDAFARYGLAMEYAKTDVDRAMQEFRTLFSKHPDYTAG